MGQVELGIQLADSPLDWAMQSITLDIGKGGAVEVNVVQMSAAVIQAV